MGLRFRQQGTNSPEIANYYFRKHYINQLHHNLFCKSSYCIRSSHKSSRYNTVIQQHKLSTISTATDLKSAFSKFIARRRISEIITWMIQSPASPKINVSPARLCQRRHRQVRKHRIELNVSRWTGNGQKDRLAVPLGFSMPSLSVLRTLKPPNSQSLECLP